MKNRVSNGVFGKTLRTLGFIILLVSSVLLFSQLILTTSNSVSDFLEPYAELVDDFASSLGFAVLEYAILGFLVGLLLIIWVIRKGFILRVLITVSALFVLVDIIVNQSALFTGLYVMPASFLESAAGSIETLFNDLVAVSKYIVPGVVLLLTLCLYILFANKKPRRLSIRALRVSMFFLILALIVRGLPLFVTFSFSTSSWYLMIDFILYSLFYGFVIVGSAIGITGFFRS